ncbi:hypothetical protein IRJ41_008787 [Triplophysa rosa]|uniref:Integrase catalytic domain-containing protein n=1 Tax=Triplophysa rosa TaxID=992332 RepID=A0A9W8C879_TRIRA|nr:hypothetical protein IRJ41_008787 [Triplophysa rosa]
MYLCQTLSRHVDVPPPIIQALQELFALVRQQIELTAPSTEVTTVAGGTGYDIDRETLAELCELNFSKHYIAKLLGVSCRTVCRRMREFGFSTKTYSNICDQDLNSLVVQIKKEMPSAGYRMVKGRLQSMGIHIQWRRVAASLHEVDSIGVLSRMYGLGCVVRRTYSVRGPLSLWHVDTNHKLIRYNIVIFGAVDGFSRKMMCLNAATNNRASTALSFFKEATERYGVPARVRADQGVENVEIASFMFSVSGIDHGSFMSGKSIHNQRCSIPLHTSYWSVTSKYYETLQSLERDHLLDLSSAKDIFCVHYIFLSKLQEDLSTFAAGWNHHPLSTEGNLSPEQKWHIGLLHTQLEQPENLEDIQEPDIDWEVAAEHDEFECPLNEQELAELDALIHHNDPNTPPTDLYAICREYVTGRCNL